MQKKNLAVSQSQKNRVNGGFDDEHFDYKIRINEIWCNRYVVKKKIGKGSFGQVVQALDQKRDEYVAIKIVKSKTLFRRQSKVEIDLLTHLNRMDPHDQRFIVRLKDTFIWRNHQVLLTA